jgi:hypothetical protein
MITSESPLTSISVERSAELFNPDTLRVAPYPSTFCPLSFERDVDGSSLTDKLAPLGNTEFSFAQRTEKSKTLGLCTFGSLFIAVFTDRVWNFSSKPSISMITVWIEQTLSQKRLEARNLLTGRWQRMKERVYRERENEELTKGNEETGQKEMKETQPGALLLLSD